MKKVKLTSKIKKIFIISDVGTNIGLGHYTRSLLLNKEIKYYLKKKIKIFNYYFHWPNSKNLGLRSILKDKLNQYIFKKIHQHSPSSICFNISRFLEPEVYSLIERIKKSRKEIIFYAIDGFIKKKKFFKKIWIPNITLKKK